MPDQNQYIVPNRAKPLTVVASSPINENWELIQEAINKNYNLASEVQNKIDNSEKGVQGGVATLDIDNKLTITQLPEEAKGHVFKVKSLAAQLSLEAFSGDICVREDTGKTYALASNSPGSFSNWIEIANIHSGGDLGGNPTYTADILSSDWQEDVASQKFTLTYEDSEHGQGQTNFLLVSVKDKLGREIDCEKTIDTIGTVTITSNVMFEGYVIISNLLGNCTNLKAVPFSIVKGYITNNIPSIINYSLHTVSLVTEPPITVIDGMDLLQNVTSSENLQLPEDVADGEYILFIDSRNILKGHLKSITYKRKKDFLGIVTTLPSKAVNGQRCYVAYDKSYEYFDGGWSTKAYTPIGEITIFNGIVTDALTYEFNQNGIIINYKSHELDYLFGNKIEGLEHDINTNVTIKPGKCLAQKRILNLKNNLVKTLDVWEEGYQGGCIDPLSNYLVTTAYEVTNEGVIYYVSKEASINSYVEAGTIVYSDVDLTRVIGPAEEFQYVYNGKKHVKKVLSYGWGSILLIGSDNSSEKIDLLLTFATDPILPIGYNIYRKIGSFYRDEKGNFRKQKQLNEMVYFVEPLKHETTISTEISQMTISLPIDVDMKVNYSIDNNQTINFYDNNIEIFESTNNDNTIEIPNTSNSITFKGSSGNGLIKFKIYGYTDRSSL